MKILMIVGGSHVARSVNRAVRSGRYAQDITTVESGAFAPMLRGSRFDYLMIQDGVHVDSEWRANFIDPPLRRGRT